MKKQTLEIGSYKDYTGNNRISDVTVLNAHQNP